VKAAPEDSPTEGSTGAGQRDPGLPPPGEHIPALDGVRGLAILLVALFHQTVIGSGNTVLAVDRWFAKIVGVGWCGVDLFFVLSGFLITGILLDARERPHYFRNFYLRRTVRIFPLYYAVVFLSLVVIPNLPEGVVPASKLASFGRVEGDDLWYWLYLSNYAIARAGMWRHGILDISWSLAIEEQFYLLWPALVLWLGRRGIARLCVFLLVGALGLRFAMFLADVHFIAIYVLTPTRIDTLAAGALVAVLVRGPAGLLGLVPPARRILAASLLLLLPAFVWRGGLDPSVDPWVYTLGFSLLTALFAALLVLALAARPGSALFTFFTHPFMRMLGKYSYAIYLFHLPLRALLRDTVYGPERFPVLFGSKIPGQLLFYAVATLLTLAVAMASWHLFEKHFLKLKRYAR
jgi:peptidoglycan/LPS O-acetylase OafA/YrhL